MPPDVQSFECLMDNYAVPANETMYHCKFIEVPQVLTEVNHLIRADPVIEEGNEGVVHHMLLFWCKNFNTSYIGFETDCNEFANMDFDGAECKAAGVQVVGWAVGGGNYYFPEHVGSPIYGKIYGLLEIHYDNPGISFICYM